MHTPLIGCNILMIDDHPLIIEGYKSILEYAEGNAISISKAFSLEQAYDMIFNSKTQAFDIIFLDVRMPAFVQKKITNGIDMAKLVRKAFPATKIIMLTMHSEPIIIYNITQTVNPEGLLIKSDIDPASFLAAYREVKSGNRYQSLTVKNIVALSKKYNASIDALNWEIIYLISKRYTVSEIAEKLGISSSTVEKRKVHIKDALNVSDGKDVDIIEISKKTGLL